ncbi:MAG: dihydropteroate synthase [Methanomicrobiales archaeon]|nr:dihydropteroate synthase [Methanomicrobiales archaeon]
MFPCTINGQRVGAGAPIRLMGVLNVSPESFFRSSYIPQEQLHTRAMDMLQQGADILDVGARATGPGSPSLSISEERNRITTALREVEGVATISVDTMYPEVLEAALKYEIHAVNDISGLINPRMGALIADAALPAILMAARERPGDARSVEEVGRTLGVVTQRCHQAGIRDYILDPGIGLWTPQRTVEDNWELCRHFSAFLALERPLLAAISRKSFLGGLLNKPAEERMFGSLALHMLLLCQGASIVRTHDVGETADTIRVFEKMRVRS